MSFFQHFAKPQGRLGRMLLRGMNKGHFPLTAYTLDAIDLTDKETLLDIGCGGGRTVSELLRRAPRARVCGMDYAPAAVRVATEYNAAAIRAGRCDICQGDARDLPYRDEVFAVVTAIETLYFWPEPKRCFAEVARVLKPGGYFLIGMESGSETAMNIFTSLIKGMVYYRPEDIRRLAKTGGLDVERIETNPKASVQLRFVLRKP